MDPSTMYLTAFLIIGGIIFLVLSSIMYRSSCGCPPKFGSKHLAGTTFPDAYP